MENKKRRNKKEYYKEERKKIILRLNELLEINDKKNYMYLYDIENDLKIREGLEEMTEEIKKYYKCGNWNHFIMLNKGERPLMISLVRALYRDEGIDLATKEEKIIRNNERVRTKTYYLIKKD